jgi:hypothetical protein
MVFLVMDVIEFLKDSSIPKHYLNKLKKKLTKEGSEVYEKIVRLKLKADGGKIAKDERLALEQKTGKKVITNDNFLPTPKGKKNLDK